MVTRSNHWAWPVVLAAASKATSKRVEGQPQPKRVGAAPSEEQQGWSGRGAGGPGMEGSLGWWGTGRCPLRGNQEAERGRPGGAGAEGWARGRVKDVSGASLSGNADLALGHRS